MTQYPAYQQRGSFRQNPWVMQIARMIADRQAQSAQPALNSEQDRAAGVAMLREMPDQPYLEGLSPLARYKDMFYRGQGRAAQAGAATRELAANQGMIEDAAVGITRQPDGRVTTTGGGVITPMVGQGQTGAPIASLNSKYGRGFSQANQAAPAGTFSFQNALGETVTAPFSALKDPKFMKMMREEEVANLPEVAARRKERQTV